MPPAISPIKDDPLYESTFPPLNLSNMVTNNSKKGNDISLKTNNLSKINESDNNSFNSNELALSSDSEADNNEEKINNENSNNVFNKTDYW